MTSPVAPTRARINPLFGLIRGARSEPLEFFLSAARGHDIVELPNPMGPFYLINDPEMTGYVLEGNYRNFPKSDFYERIRTLFGDGLFELEGEAWKKKRQLVQRPFHRPNIEKMVGMMVVEIEGLLDRWEAAADAGETFDIFPPLTATTLNIISKALCSSSVRCDLEELSTALGTVMREGERILWSLAPAMRKIPTPHRLAVKRSLRVIDDMIFQLVTARIESKIVVGDLLDTLLGQRDEHGQPISLQVIRDDLLTMLIAGHETTAAAIAWASAAMSRSPHVYERLREETITTLGDRTPEVGDLGRLDYASWTFQEALRLYPPFWTVSRKALASDVLTSVGGRTYAIPAGATLMLCPYVLHRNEAYWSNPEGFLPERFAPAQTAARHKWAYFPFGGGPRTCLGKHFALIEGQLFLSLLSRRLNLHLEPGSNLAAEAMISLRPKNGVHMKALRNRTPAGGLLAAE